MALNYDKDIYLYICCMRSGKDAVWSKSFLRFQNLFFSSVFVDSYLILIKLHFSFFIDDFLVILQIQVYVFLYRNHQCNHIGRTP